MLILNKFGLSQFDLQVFNAEKLAGYWDPYLHCPCVLLTLLLLV